MRMTTMQPLPHAIVGAGKLALSVAAGVVLGTAASAAIAQCVIGCYIPTPTAPVTPVPLAPSTAQPATPIGLRPSALQGIRLAPTAAVPTAVTPPASEVPEAFTTVVRGPASAPGESPQIDAPDASRRAPAAVRPHAELPRPAECVVQGEFEKTTAAPHPLWAQLMALAEQRRRGETDGDMPSKPGDRVRPVVGDRGVSRSSDLGLAAPVRGPARDVFAAPSHVVRVNETEVLPPASRRWFEGGPIR